MQECVKFNRGDFFEEKLIQAMLMDAQFAEQLIEVLDIEYFSVEYLKTSCKYLFKYYEKYKTFPSIKIFNDLVRKNIESEIVRDQILDYLLRTKKELNVNDLDYVKQESLEFCKKRKLILAFEQAMQHIEKQNYDEIACIMQKALQAGTERNIGHNFKEDFEARMIPELRNPISTGWDKLDKLLKGGGISGGELMCIAAPTGVGKSISLVDMGAYSSLQGKNVLHFSLELSERDVGNKYDARISNIALDDLIAFKEKVRESVMSISGKIIIKSLPAREATTLTIKNHINRLKIKGIIPDLIIVDYADLLSSQKHYDQRRSEMAHIFRELRGLSQEFNIPFVTAAQTNRESLDEPIITLKHIAECFEIAMICDLFITINRNKQMPCTNSIGNMHIAKSRLGADGMVFPISVNTTLSKVNLTDPDITTNMQIPQSISDGSVDQDRLRIRIKQIRESIN